jgi:hypothetical protein
MLQNPKRPPQREFLRILFVKAFWRRGRDLNPRYPFGYGRLSGGCFQPDSATSADAPEKEGRITTDDLILIIPHCIGLISRSRAWAGPRFRHNYDSPVHTDARG